MLKLDLANLTGVTVDSFGSQAATYSRIADLGPGCSLARCVRLAAYSLSIGLFAATIPAAYRPQPPEHRCTWPRIRRK